MDLICLDKQSKVQLIYNCIQIMENILLFVISEFSEISVIQEYEEFTEAEVIANGEQSKLSIKYLPSAIKINFPSSLTLYFNNYIQPFYHKRYTVSNSNLFSKLINPSGFRNLYYTIKSFFSSQVIVFQAIPIEIFSRILSFLHKNEIFHLRVLSRSLNQYLDQTKIWSSLYRLTHADQLIKEIDIDWRKACFENSLLKLQNPVKLVSLPIRN